MSCMKAPRQLFVPCLLLVALGHSVAALNLPRQGIIPPTITPGAPSTPPIGPPGSSTSSPTSITQPITSNTFISTSSLTSTSSTPTSTSTTPPPAMSSSASLSVTPTKSILTSTDSAGSIVTVTVINSSSSTEASASSTATSAASGGGSGFGTGSIIGVSVAGGIAVLAIVAFFVWKFTRKRFNDFDDNEAIKWPELNSHGGNAETHALPVHNTGRAGFDTGSEASLSRAPSVSKYSAPEFGNGGPDPYAVPPLPHMNPNQPYRDDPTAATGYYDPYRGPIPGTLEHGVDDYGEAIPMTQMGRTSPGPQAALGGGRNSPAPYGAGRSSPGPQVAYGGGRASPIPQALYPAGRLSPGPQVAYESYGGR